MKARDVKTETYGAELQKHEAIILLYLYCGKLLFYYLRFKYIGIISFCGLIFNKVFKCCGTTILKLLLSFEQKLPRVFYSCYDLIKVRKYIVSAR